MIALTRLNNTPLFLNSDLIEQVQAIPDTVITLTSGHNFRVLETPGEIIDRIVQFRRSILRDTCCRTTPAVVTSEQSHG